MTHAQSSIGRRHSGLQVFWSNVTAASTAPSQHSCAAAHTALDCAVLCHAAQAFLRAGAKAVIAPSSGPLAPATAAALPALLASVLGGAVAGRPLLDALHAAEAAHPELEGVLAVYHL